jgi:hypothetical protein
MKKAVIVLFLLASLPCFAQTDNTFYVKQFKGSTVGAKIAAAQNACSSNSLINCFIMIEPSLAAWPAGMNPTPCAQCIWVDFRTQMPFGGIPVSGGALTGPFLAPAINTGANDISTATTWHGVLQNAYNSTVHLIVIGDSISTGTPNMATGPWWQFYLALQKKFGGYGEFFSMNQTTKSYLTLTGTWNGVPGAIYQTAAQGPTAINSIFKATGGATACFTVAQTGGSDYYQFFPYTNSDSGTFQITVDGVTVGTYSTTTTTLQPLTGIINSMTISGHTVCAVAPSSGYLYLFGGALSSGSKGARIWNFSIPGAVSAAYGAGPGSDLSYINGFLVSSVFTLSGDAVAAIALGQNDQWQSASAIISNLSIPTNQLAGYNVPIAIVLTEPPSNQSSTMDSTINGVIQWAQSKGFAIVNIYGEWGSYAYSNNNGMYADSVHPSYPKGQNAIADSLKANLGAGLNLGAYSSDQISPQMIWTNYTNPSGCQMHSNASINSGAWPIFSCYSHNGAGTVYPFHMYFDNGNQVLHFATSPTESVYQAGRETAFTDLFTLPVTTGLFLSGQGTPTFAAGPGAGTSPGTPACASSHFCDSISGTVQMSTGTATPTTGVVLTITWNVSNLPAYRNCSITANNTSTGAVTPLYPTGSSTTLTGQAPNIALAASTSYQFTYVCGR